MKDMLVRILSGFLHFSVNFIVWFVVPEFLVENAHLEMVDLEILFYISLAISALAGLSGFYRKKVAGTVFSMGSDVAILAYVLYLSGGGTLSVDVMGFRAVVDISNLLFILLLPLVFSLVGKVWKLATLEAERRVRIVEEG